MTLRMRQLLLRVNAIFLVAAAAGGFANDVRGIFLGSGPVAPLIALAPHAGIGFIEAHGLAFILGVLLWFAPPRLSWHLAAAAVHLLLGTANIVFWQIFLAADALAVGYITTALHGVFAALQLLAATAAALHARGSMDRD